jgi:hypothetical protein
MAIEGLAQVADSEGVEFVKDALTAVIANQADDALQSAAVVQFLRLDPDGATSSLRALLASRHKHLVDLEFRRSPVGVDERPRVLGLDAGESPLPPLRDKKGS